MKRIAAAALVLTLLFALEARADVRPISHGERAAVGMAAEYLGGGPAAIVSKLSSKSPLRKVAPQLLEVEIETRLGPRAGARWELVTVVDALKDRMAAFSVSYPSGIDETVFFDLVSENGSIRLNDIRILAMPSTRAEYFAKPEAAPSKSEKASSDSGAGLTGVGAAVLALAGILLMPVNAKAARALLGVAFLSGSASLAMMVTSRMPEKAGAAAAVANDSSLSLARLTALRSALAAGGSGVDAAMAGLPSTGAIADVAKLWKAQWDFQQGRTSVVERALQSLPMPSNTPLVEILRARVALAKNDPAAAVLAYQRAINLGPGRDSLWLEQASALAAGGFEDEARKTLERVTALGSRDAGLYYVNAMISREPEECEKQLARAWTLQPVERGNLLQSGVLWSLVRKRDGQMLINLSEPHEATVAAAALSSRAIAIPETAIARVAGEYLHIQNRDTELGVPGGAALAPLHSQKVDAGERSRAEQELALIDAASLIALAPTSSSYMQPALRERIVTAAKALSTRNRWTDVVRLTEAIRPKSEFVPTELFLLRATALQHENRTAEAKQLLEELAGSPVLVRKRDVLALQQVGDMLSSHDLFDLSIRMFERANAIRDDGYAEVRIQQVAMDKRLANEYETHASPNFEIHYPPDMERTMADAISRVLEGELKRLQRWVPVKDFKPVVVNIVWWQDFTRTYTGGENILGFYNGKITLPLAGIGEMPPEIVSLITHELCHAMIAQASRNQAPRWFHEGLAQRVEMVPYHANAFNMYDDQKLLAVSVLDPAFNVGRDGDLIAAAYLISSAFVRYIEGVLGEAGIRALIARFAEGATSEEAVAAVSGRSLADFDASFRTWGRAEKRVFENSIAVRYDGEAGAVIATGEAEKPKRGSIGRGTFYPTRRDR